MTHTNHDFVYSSNGPRCLFVCFVRARVFGKVGKTLLTALSTLSNIKRRYASTPSN